MPILTGQIEAQGPILYVKVMQSPQRVAFLKKVGRHYAPPVAARSIIDTGAAGTALDRTLITALGLEHCGVVSIHTPSTGSAYVQRNQFDASLVLGDEQPDPLILTLPVIECDFASEGFLALIGRDVLNRCQFHYDGPAGTFTRVF
jgi:hypothetical protein